MKKSLLVVCLLILCSLTLLAQIRTAPRVVNTKESPAIHVPPQEAPASFRKIYSNLGTSQTNLYLDHKGWLVLGPHSVDQPQEFIGLHFVPKFDSHVLQVRAALQYVGFGANQANLSLYGDSDGSPGTLLAGPVTVINLPRFGTCCILAVANFAPVAVTGGTTYWVVADTPLTGQGSDFTGVWSFVVAVFPLAFDNGSGWFIYDVDQQVAGDVRGTIP